MSEINRRRFLDHSRKTTLGMAGGITVLANPGSVRAAPANDRLVLAMIGVGGGRGHSLATGFLDRDDCEIGYVCDVNRRLHEPRAKEYAARQGKRPKCLHDFREMLEDASVDAVVIATPPHWHALATILCCRTGKDVYCEKPQSHNCWEGRRAVEAARKYDRIVQMGTQRRSDPQWIRLVDDVRSGKYGKLLVSYGFDRRQRLSIGIKDPQEPPRELDFNLWLGPASGQPFRANLVHYNWHWAWDFGNGEIGNLGSHELDVCRWAMPVGAAPKSVVGLGGRFGYKDQGQTPNTQLTMIDFGEVKLLHEVRGLVGEDQWKITNAFYTDEGVVRDGMFFAKGKGKGVPIADFPPPGAPEQGPRHMQVFIDCVRSRKREDLHAEILEGHQSTLLAHLGNISYCLGKDVPFDRLTRIGRDDKLFGESFEDMKRHLVDADRMELDNSTCRLGRKLSFDAEAEKFVAAPEANRLLNRPYRGPFVLPERV